MSRLINFHVYSLKQKSSISKYLDLDYLEEMSNLV